jgi:hypothetical protein
MSESTTGSRLPWETEACHYLLLHVPPHVGQKDLDLFRHPLQTAREKRQAETLHAFVQSDQLSSSRLFLNP